MSKHSPYVETRISLLRSLLISQINENVSFVKIKEFAKKESKETLGKDTITGSLRILRAGLGSDYHLTIGTNYAKLERTDAELVEIRLQKRPLTKSEIGCALWNALFNVDLDHQKGMEKTITPGLAQRLKSIVSKLNISVVMDAGSSTLATFDSLLRVKKIPFNVKYDSTEYLVRPSIITNSAIILEKWKACRFVRSLRLSMIGGECFPDRMSICGPFADLCLESWKDFRADVSIIGATACSTGPEGQRAFACDDINESQIKARLLRTGWVKTLVLDSSKLVNQPGYHIFAALGSGVDLIVTDDGMVTPEGKPTDKIADAPTAPFVSAFQSVCERAGVSTVIVKARD